MLDKEFYLYYFFSFFLISLYISIVNRVYLIFQDVFFVSSFYEFFFQYCSVFYIWLVWNRWFRPSKLGYTVWFFKCLWMFWMCMEIGLLISGFSVESCLKSVVLVLIYCTQTWDIAVWNIVFKSDCFMFSFKIFKKWK